VPVRKQPFGEVGPDEARPARDKRVYSRLLDPFDLAPVDVDADDAETGLGELDDEGKTDTTETDHADTRHAPLEERFKLEHSKAPFVGPTTRSARHDRTATDT
jgi:hypothetical protein